MADVSTASRAELEELLTEAISAHQVNLAGIRPAELAKTLTSRDHAASAAILAASHEVSIAVERILPRLQSFGRLICLSADKPGQVRILDRSNIEQNNRVRHLWEMDLDQQSTPPASEASKRALADANFDNGLTGSADVLALELTPRDCLIGIFGAANSPYVYAALKSAQRSGALAIGVCNSSDQAAELATDQQHIVLALPLDETAHAESISHFAVQQMLVNLVSAVCVARVNGSMQLQTLDLRATSESLFTRNQRTIMTATGIDAAAAAEILASAGGSTKMAILMQMTGLSASRAHEILFRAESAFENAAESHGR